MSTTKCLPRTVALFVNNLFRVHLFPTYVHFGSWKNSLHKNCISGTVVMFQLTQNSPTSAYKSLNPRKWKFALVETALCGD